MTVSYDFYTVKLLDVNLTLQRLYFYFTNPNFFLFFNDKNRGGQLIDYQQYSTNVIFNAHLFE